MKISTINQQSYTTTTRDIFTPELDRFTGGKFAGSHHDMLVVFERTSDTLKVSISWARDTAGKFTSRDIQTYSIKDFLETLRFDCESMGVQLACEDNLPEGITVG